MLLVPSESHSPCVQNLENNVRVSDDIFKIFERRFNFIIFSFSGAEAVEKKIFQLRRRIGLKHGKDCKSQFQCFNVQTSLLVTTWFSFWESEPLSPPSLVSPLAVLNFFLLSSLSLIFLCLASSTSMRTCSLKGHSLGTPGSFLPPSLPGFLRFSRRSFLEKLKRRGKCNE